MPDRLARQHIGLVLTFFGTVLLALSVKVKRQYSGDTASEVDKLKEADPDLVEPTETYIVRRRFRAGLFLIGIGTVLQW